MSNPEKKDNNNFLEKFILNDGMAYLMHFHPGFNPSFNRPNFPLTDFQMVRTKSR